ncbi:MAG: deoxyguanosinetriphosphate triphosphohydrolase [Firmicutes bacterium]|nr:deoxyguanosinetriphosphate triphosphohydrolase [Bacillota bacterium]
MPTIREVLEEHEMARLSPWAARSRNSKGRQREEPQCPFRTVYQRDRDRIIHSKAFRRLKHKTQVFIAPSGDHYRTRLTHTLEVSQISRTIGRALGLNEDLIEAVAMAHDVGHTPFGHSGEYALQEIIGHFKHNEQSLRVVDCIEKQGEGLNLTWEVRDGILHHTGDTVPATLESQVLKICDRIGYICHDIDDSIRAGLISINDLPQEHVQILGKTHSQMITTMVADIITSSMNQPEIRMSQPVLEAMNGLRDFMFEQVYLSPFLEEERKKAQFIIEKLYEFFTRRPEKLPPEYIERIERWGLQQTVVDYVASMTDRFAINTFESFFVPSPFHPAP